MRNRIIRSVSRAIVVAAMSSLLGTGGSCTSDSVGGFSSGFGSGFGTDNSVEQAAIIGLQGDLTTSCGGFGCNFDFGGDF